MKHKDTLGTRGFLPFGGASSGASLLPAAGGSAGGGFMSMFNKMGGIGGIFSAIGKVQKAIGLMNQIAPLIRMMNSMGPAEPAPYQSEDENELPPEPVERPARKKRTQTRKRRKKTTAKKRRGKPRAKKRSLPDLKGRRTGKPGIRPINSRPLFIS